MNRILRLCRRTLPMLLAVLLARHAQTQTFGVLYTFSAGGNGSYPTGLTIVGTSLYGTTFGDGAFHAGTVFRLNTGGQTVLYSFTGGTDGANPLAGLTTDAAGNFYGTTTRGGDPICGCGTVFKLSPPATKNDPWVENVLYAFPWPGTSGESPRAGVALDGAGNLYGTTSGGGAFAYGTVFKLDNVGEQTVLHDFNQGGRDGSAPAAAPILDIAGNLYGTTTSGGSRNDGTLFKIDPDGNETVLHSFRGKPGDGRGPIAGLIRDAAGNLYGTTDTGGAFGHGTVFAMNKNGKGALLYSFTGDADGGRPQAGLIRDAAGNLYGTTGVGGNLADCRIGNVRGCGTIFALSPPATQGGAWTQTVLYRFTGGADGAYPLAGLTSDGIGNFYGTTAGCHNILSSHCSVYNYGTVFKITP